jgi:hypothetical protein
MYGVGQSSPQKRGPGVIIGVMVLVLLVGGLFYVFYSLVLDNQTETSTPSPAITTTAQAVSLATETIPPMTNTVTAIPATATTTPTRTPTHTPEPTATLLPPPEVITVGVRARVNISEGLAINLRDMPSLSGSTVITQLVANARVDVIGGPEDVGDLRWWNVDGGPARIGWMVEAFGGETWLVPEGWVAQMPPLYTPVPTNTPEPAPTATLAATAAITPTETPTVAATATPELTATATVVLTPTATPEGGISSPTVGGRAQVTTRFEFVNLRETPGLGGETVGQLANGTIVTILEGPEEADNLRWWRVEDSEGNVGWAAERVAGEVLLVPIE